MGQALLGCLEAPSFENALYYVPELTGTVASIGHTTALMAGSRVMRQPGLVKMADWGAS